MSLSVLYHFLGHCFINRVLQDIKFYFHYLNKPSYTGTSFQPVLSDPAITNPSKVERVVLVSGKHYYTLTKHIQDNAINNVAVIRLESLCPFPAGRLQEEMKKFSGAKKFVWSQEEHRNMGAWSYLQPR